MKNIKNYKLFVEGIKTSYEVPGKKGVYNDKLIGDTIKRDYHNKEHLDKLKNVTTEKLQRYVGDVISIPMKEEIGQEPKPYEYEITNIDLKAGVILIQLSYIGEGDMYVSLREPTLALHTRTTDVQISDRIGSAVVQNVINLLVDYLKDPNVKEPYIKTRYILSKIVKTIEELEFEIPNEMMFTDWTR